MEPGTGMPGTRGEGAFVMVTSRLCAGGSTTGPVALGIGKFASHRGTRGPLGHSRSRLGAGKAGLAV